MDGGCRIAGEICRLERPVRRRRWHMEQTLLIFAGFVFAVVVVLTLFLRRMGRKIVSGQDHVRRGAGSALLGLQEFIVPSVEYVVQGAERRAAGARRRTRAWLRRGGDPLRPGRGAWLYAHRSRRGSAAPLRRRADRHGLEGSFRAGGARRGPETALSRTVHSPGKTRRTQGLT